MVFNATFNSISVISWRSDLLVEYPEKTTDLPQVAVQNLEKLQWSARTFVFPFIK